MDLWLAAFVYKLVSIYHQLACSIKHSGWLSTSLYSCLLFQLEGFSLCTWSSWCGPPLHWGAECGSGPGGRWEPGLTSPSSHLEGRTHAGKNTVWLGRVFTGRAAGPEVDRLTRCRRHWEGLLCVCSCVSNWACTQVPTASFVFEEVHDVCEGSASVTSVTYSFTQNIFHSKQTDTAGRFRSGVFEL